MKKVFVAFILSLATSMAFVSCNTDKEKKEIEKMDFSHEKSRARKRDYGFFEGKGKITARLYSYDMQALCTHMR